MSTLNSTSSYVVGLMSGTSLDGIDAALVKITETDKGIDIKLVHYLSHPYSDVVKGELLKLCVPETASVENIAAMNIFLGEVFSEITLMLIKEAGLSTDDILLIGSHGQTIFHQPEPVIIESKEIRSTLQIGDISIIAERTGITTVGDFRTRDIAAGGQGAPLVPYADYFLFAEKEFGRVLVNIGGIANITVIPKDAQQSDVCAYDTGPGNMIIDIFTNWATNGLQSYDEGGALAAKGIVHEKWLNQILQHPYFKRSSPKSTGREMFGIDYAKELWNESELQNVSHEDKIATLTELTAKTIAIEITKYIKACHIKEVLISGGGRYNQTLMDRIDFHLKGQVTVLGTEEYGMNADAKEAIIFALLGYQCYHKRTNNLPSATGANKEVIMGKISW